MTPDDIAAGMHKSKIRALIASAMGAWLDVIEGRHHVVEIAVGHYVEHLVSA
jgi:hypothetical protein